MPSYRLWNSLIFPPFCEGVIGNGVELKTQMFSLQPAVFQKELEQE